MNAEKSQVIQHPSFAEAYIQHGWKVVPIPPGSKGPKHPGWNKLDGCLISGSDLPEGFGLGLAHAYSGTMALDIDNFTLAALWLAERGINLQSLLDGLDSVQINSGNPGHHKLIFAMPFGLSLASKKITIDGVTALEFRCGTANGLTVQDVLPPSKHPSGTTYQWAGRGDWQHLPMLPSELLDVWNDLLKSDTERLLPGRRNSYPLSWVELESALQSISPDVDRKAWIEVGMGIHAAAEIIDDSPRGFALWDAWSSKGTKYNAGEMAAQWRSFKPNTLGITPATVFHHARKAGWERPIPDVSEMFGEVSTEPDRVLDRLFAGPPAPVVNLDLWPTLLSDCAREVGTEVGCDPVVPLMAGLLAVSAAADKRTRLRMTETWQVPPVLWAMTIGSPSDKKTPGSKPMFEVLRQLEREDIDRFKVEHHHWVGLEARVAAQLKAYREFQQSPDSSLPNAVPPAVEDLPLEPQPLRLLFNDATSQKVVHLAQNRPRGFLLHLDEMNHWLKKINDPRGGDDRGCWIHGYESTKYTMDRVGAGTISAENLAVSIYGNCQPNVFRDQVIAAANDGLAQRFIPVMLNINKTDLWQNSLPEFLSSKPAYESMIRQVYSLQPTTYDCSAEAIELFRAFCEWRMDTMKKDILIRSGDIYMTAAGKLEGTTLRLCLLLQMIQQPYNPIVSIDVMAQTVGIMKQFIVPSLRHAFLNLAGTDNDCGKWIMEYIIQLAGVRTTITMTEIRHTGRHQWREKNFLVNDEMIRGTMDELCREGYCTILNDFGRHITWIINPDLATVFAHRRKAIIDAKQSLLDHFADDAAERGKPMKNPGKAIGSN